MKPRTQQVLKPTIAALAATALITACASATSIVVTNFDLELPATSDGVINTSSAPTGWSYSSTATTNPGIFNPSSSQLHYTGMGDADPNGGVLPNMVGPSFAFMFPNNANTGQYTQTVGAALQADTTYTLTVAVGMRNYFNAGQVPKDFRISIETATTNTLIAQFTGDVLNQNPFTPGENNTGTIILSESTFTDFSAIGVTGASPTGLGESLVIRIEGLADGRYLDFDNVRLDASPIPEPGSLALLGLGLVTLIRRRR